jgi:hypothetical protein
MSRINKLNELLNVEEMTEFCYGFCDENVKAKIKEAFGELPKLVFDNRVGEEFDLARYVFEFSDGELVGIDAYYSSYEGTDFTGSQFYPAIGQQVISYSHAPKGYMFTPGSSVTVTPNPTPSYDDDSFLEVDD